MIYKHELWDSMIKILDYTVGKLEKTGPGVMCAEVRQIRDTAVKGFDLSLT